MRSDGNLAALRRPLSPGLPLSHASKEVATLPCYSLKAPTILWGAMGVPTMGDDYSNEL